jgi:hypothetical protein
LVDGILQILSKKRGEDAASTLAKATKRGGDAASTLGEGGCAEWGMATKNTRKHKKLVVTGPGASPAWTTLYALLTPHY